MWQNTTNNWEDWATSINLCKALSSCWYCFLWPGIRQSSWKPSPWQADQLHSPAFTAHMHTQVEGGNNKIYVYKKNSRDYEAHSLKRDDLVNSHTSRVLPGSRSILRRDVNSLIHFGNVPLWGPGGVKSRVCLPYPQRDRRRRLNGAVCRNHRIKRVVPCRC